MKFSFRILLKKYKPLILNRITDLIVVIIGITIAFFIEQRGKSIDEREEQKRYLTAILSDIEKDFQELSKTQIPFNQFKNSEIKTALQNLNQVEEINDTTLLHIKRTFVSVNATLNNDSYESIKQSGQLNEIGNISIVKPIVIYYKNAEKLKEIKNMNLEHLDKLTEYCSDKGKFTMVKDQYGLITVDFPDPLLRDFKFINLLTRWQILIDFKVSEYQKVKTQAEVISKLINTELKKIN